MNMTPREWLLCDVARSYGLSKATWSERLAWARSHPNLEEGAKEPFLYKSALKASRSAVTDHLVSLDATASGIQCLALMAQDPLSALKVNLGTQEVRNPYQEVCEFMSGYAYDDVKAALMTCFYESVAVPLNLFRDDYDKFIDKAREMLPGPWLMKDAIASCMDNSSLYTWTMMDGFVVNMEVKAPVECSMDIGGVMMQWCEWRQAAVATKGLTANVTHSLDAMVLREVIRRSHANVMWNDNTFETLRHKDLALMQSVLRWQMSSFVSFELFDHLDEHNGALVPQKLRKLIDARTTHKDMYLQPIHDCYRVRATDASRLFAIVREVMADMAYAKTAHWLLPQLGYKGKINDDEDARKALRAQVLRSEYLIC